ncbi:hypothetical protein GCM10022221_63360 [Actinocorallia aurea]
MRGRYGARETWWSSAREGREAQPMTNSPTWTGPEKEGVHEGDGAEEDPQCDEQPPGRLPLLQPVMPRSERRPAGNRK